MKFILLITAMTLCFCSFGEDLVFKLNGKVVKSFPYKSLNTGEVGHNNRNVGSVDKTIFNPIKGYERTYRGYDLYEILDVVYGNSWREAKMIKFHALDNYKQITSVKKMLAEAGNDRRGYISFKETGKRGEERFSTYVRNGKKVILGPYYLIWSGFKRGDKVSTKDHMKWPYQLKTVEISK